MHLDRPRKLSILLIIVLVVSAGFLSYKQVQNKQTIEILPKNFENNTNSDVHESTKLEEKPTTKTEKPSTPPDLISSEPENIDSYEEVPSIVEGINSRETENEIKSELDKIFGGYIKPNNDLGNYFPFYSESWTDGITVFLYVYSYSPGKIFTFDYYGNDVDYDLDTEVSTISSLEEGKNIALIQGPFNGPKHEANFEVTYKKIGDNYFGYYDTGFAPADTDNRVYFTYDEKNNQLVYIEIAFYEMGNGIKMIPSELDKSVDVKVFPEDYLYYLSTFEDNFLN